MKTVACASQECEAAALQKVTKDGLVIGEMMKAFLMLKLVMKNGREDNMGLVKCLRKGGISTALAHSRRAHGIKLAFLSDVWDQYDCDLAFQSGVLHPGDPYTKPLDIIPTYQMTLIPYEAREILDKEPEFMIFDTIEQVNEDILPAGILKKGKKKFEIACYKNTVTSFRAGNETDLDNVLQIPNVIRREIIEP